MESRWKEEQSAKVLFPASINLRKWPQSELQMKSDVNKRKRKGERTEPCGAPALDYLMECHILRCVSEVVNDPPERDRNSR